MDIWSIDKRSAVMSSIRKTGTKPEMALQGIVTSALPRWKVMKNSEIVLGRPDVYVPSLKLAIFADGCFWHSCPKHGNIPKSRTEYWGPKLKGNSTRDRRIDRQLRSQGISVWRVWEHDLRGSALSRTALTLASRLETRVDSRRRRLGNS